MIFQVRIFSKTILQLVSTYSNIILLIKYSDLFLDEIQEKVKYLEQHFEDPELVKRYWVETHNTRMSILKIERKSVDEYLRQFKALREQLCREFVYSFCLF